MNKTLLATAGTGILSLLLAHAAYAQAAATRPAAATADKTVPPEVDAAFAAWDLDKNGALSLNEFRSGWVALRRAGELQARLRTQFHTVDANKNDAIDASEYGSLVLVKRAGKSAPPLSTFDTNKDQRLEFGEYVELVQRLAAAEQAASPAPAPRK
jgi:hypothetical protein